MKRVAQLFCLGLFGALALRAEGEFLPGEGWQPTAWPLYVGGYASLWAEGNDREQSLRLDEMALMLYGDFERWRFMLELEMDEPYSRYFGDREEETIRTGFYLERLYLTWYPDERSDLKVGKFFSDVGFWNTYAINVLRDTTSDPHFVETMFPEMTTGFRYRRYLSEGLLTLTIQHNPGLDEQYDNINADRHYAVAYTRWSGEGEWRMGGGWFRERGGEGSAYATLSYRMEADSLTLMGESALRKLETKHAWGYDLYLQGVWHVACGHDLIARIETFDDREAETPATVWGVVGYTYRPLPYMALKGEVDLYDHGPGRWLFSFSVMF